MNVDRERTAKIIQDNSMKNTLWPFLIHMILCLVEHMIVVCKISTAKSNQLQRGFLGWGQFLENL